MRVTKRKMLWAFLAVLSVTGRLAASDAVIRGLITDTSGKPIRGATVKVNMGDKSISRFSQKDGRYEITVPAGKYAVSVDAFGFGIKRQTKDTSEPGDMNFQVSRSDWKPTQLSGAEVGSFLPENAEGDAIRNKCVGCHSLGNPEARRGWSAEEFGSWLPVMFRRGDTVGFDNLLHEPEALDKMVELLGKYFGPESPAPTPETVKHVEVADEALNATFVEYNVSKEGVEPRGLRPFVARVDPKRGYVWFTSMGNQNHILRFNMKTEKIEAFPDGDGHGILFGKDGTVWMASERHNYIIELDPETVKMKTYDYEADFRLLGGQKTPVASGHFLAWDQAGNLWMTSNFGPNLYKFQFTGDTMQMQIFPNAPNPPRPMTGLFESVPGEKPDPPGTGMNLNSSYDVMVDSKGLVWRTQAYNIAGRLLAFDPATGKDKAYMPPINIGTRGIAIDPQDNIWFSITAPGTSTTVGAHGIGKFDQKTQKFTLYQTPTRYSVGYGIFYDKNTGYIWWADLNGSNVTRFDPKTEKFTEFPVPNHAMEGGYLSTDEDGRVWFAENYSHRIAVLDPGDRPTQKATQ